MVSMEPYHKDTAIYNKRRIGTGLSPCGDRAWICTIRPDRCKPVTVTIFYHVGASGRVELPDFQLMRLVRHRFSMLAIYVPRFSLETPYTCFVPKGVVKTG